jgi:CheY-like chemotaxis protein
MGQSKTCSIVIIEDNPADVLLIRKALEQQCVKCGLTCFQDGGGALKNLSQKGRLLPDLILLDLKLPNADGIDVLRSIRSTPRFVEVPVVILTSSDSSSDKQRTARMGATRYIRKPSGLEEFFREVGHGVEEMLYRENLRDLR